MTRLLPSTAAEGPPADDRGSAMIAVTMIGLVAVLAVSGLAGRVVAEHRAVEDSLAQTRLYWAGMGHATYLLSRNRQSGPCGGASPCSQVNDLKRGGTRILAEIAALRRWRYPEIGDAYAFTVAPDLSQVEGANGRLQVTIGFGQPPDAPQALRTASRTPAVELRYCLAGQDAAACFPLSPPLPPSGPANGWAASTAHLVTSVHRGARPTN